MPNLYSSTLLAFIECIVGRQPKATLKFWKIPFWHIFQQTANWLIKFLKQQLPNQQQPEILLISYSRYSGIKKLVMLPQYYSPEAFLSQDLYGDNKHNNYQVTFPAYCDCDFPKSPSLYDYTGSIPDLVKCRCGEDDPLTHSLHWNWQECHTTNAIIQGQDITFHPTYSQGTAIVRGQQPLAAGMLHFWEIRTITALSGTDVMFGIGTDQVDLNQFQFYFTSALGINSQSWGLSYEGKIHHNGKHFHYGPRFSQGCIVGVLLDRIRGRLEFFLNRRPLGIAYTNIPTDPRIKIYPMVCSTAASSAIRLINAISQKESLQLRAFRELAKQPKTLEEMRQLPGFKSILRNYWFLAPPVRYSRESEAKEFDLLDEVVLSSTKRVKRIKLNTDHDSNDINDLYEDAHVPILNDNSDSDSDCSEFNFDEGDYFDEYFHVY